MFLVVAGKDGGNGLVLALESDADKAGQGVLFLFGADFFGGVGKGVAGGERVVNEVTDTLGEGADSGQFVEGAETADMLEGFCGEVLDLQLVRCLCHDDVHGCKLMYVVREEMNKCVKKRMKCEGTGMKGEKREEDG